MGKRNDRRPSLLERSEPSWEGLDDDETRLRASSPLRLAALVLFVVVAVELGVMVCLGWLPELPSMTRSVIDAAVLAVVMVPFLYLLLLRPMRRQLESLAAADRDKEVLIAQLRYAADKVKTLRGLIPMCAVCARVKDERGRWQALEEYLRERSEATLAHGYCPSCAPHLAGDSTERTH